jgi:type I restriction enzyme S subunit
VNDMGISTSKPLLRFRGFADAWEQSRAKELVTITTGKSNTQDQKEDGIYPFYIRSETPVKSSKYLYDEEAVITIGDGQIGKVFHYIDGKFDLHQRCYKMSDFTNLTGKFFYYYFSTTFYKRAMKMTAKATVDSVRLEMISNMVIRYPKNVKEQDQISSLLSNLDNLITFHQHGHEKLINIKQGLLERIFPKQGEVVPRIRFKGFADAWDQFELGEISDIVGGGTPSTLVADYWNGDIDWYSPVEIGDNIYVDSSQNKITQPGLENSSARLLPIGTVLFTSRAGIGKTAILAKEGCTNQGFQSILPKTDKLDSYFIYSRALEIKKYSETIGAGSTFIEVSGKQLSKMLIMVPKIQEQRMIGSYFEKIDKLIALHQRKYEKLINIKKALLERMFVQ